MYTIIDIEGNGAAYREECIIDIAIYQYDGHEIKDQFISLVNPESPITPFVQKLTAITPKMVKTAPKFHEIAKRIIEITKDSTLVGHNIDFDYRMLRQSFKRLGYDFKIETLDTITLAKKIFPEAESYSLGKLVKSLGIPLINQHRADSDARATLELFKLMMIKDENLEIIQAQHDETNADNYVNKIKTLTQDLPSEKGIVYFQDKAGQILYYDFVKNIHKASIKLFNSTALRWKKVQENCQQIYYQPASTMLIAQLLWLAKGIKKNYTPLYGLFEINQHYKVEKLKLHQDKKPLLQFNSYTQGLKILHFLKKSPQLSQIDMLMKRIHFTSENRIFSTSGNTKGEKLFILLENKKITGFGYYEYHSQISTKRKIEARKITIPNSASLQNEIKIGLLDESIQTYPFPSK